ncbi:hypothetical protein RDn1_287, partial [Candidatus Termititenax dinenymphae]
VTYHQDIYRSSLVMGVWMAFGKTLSSLNKDLANKIADEPQVIGNPNLASVSSDVRKLVALRQ